MATFLDYRDYLGSSPDKPYKATLVRSDRLMLGVNCLSPGQSQLLHTHDGQDKFYLVLEGSGDFVVGAETRRAGAGTVVWAPAGVEHGVTNHGAERLVVLIGIAPFHGR